MKLAITYNHLPSALFLEGVNYTTDEARGSGSMGDVFVGVWGEKVVAIKRLRVDAVNEVARENFTKVSFTPS